VSISRKLHGRSLPAGVILILVFLLIGCGGKGPTDPGLVPTGQPAVRSPETEWLSDGRVTWGYWDITIDPVNMTSEVVPLRTGQVHYNVLQMLEGWACKNCVGIEGLSWSEQDTLLVDISIRHPYAYNRLDLTGRDVRGVAIFNGTSSFPYHTVRDENGVEQPLLASRVLLNADGWTTHFNRETAKEGLGLFDYRRGKMTFPDENTIIGNLHPFKYFYTDVYKRLFRPGYTKVQTYELAIKPASPFTFAYSVDAAWNFPLKWPVIDPINDFDLSANAREAFQISTFTVTVDDNTLTRQGGHADVTFEIWDHQGFSSISTITIEAPDLFVGTISVDPSTPAWTTEESARYKVTINNETGHAKTEDGGSDVLFVVEDLNQSVVGEDLRAYEITTLAVEDVPMGWRPRDNTFANLAFPGPIPPGPNYDMTVISDPQDPWAFEQGESMLVFTNDDDESYTACNRDFSDWVKLAGYPANPHSWLLPTRRIDAASTGAFGVVSDSDVQVSGEYLVKHCTNMHNAGGTYTTSWFTGTLGDPSPFLELARDVSGGFGSAIGDPVYALYLFDPDAGYAQPAYTSLHRIGAPYNDPDEVLRAYVPLSASLSGGAPPYGVSFNDFAAMAVDDDPVGEESPFAVYVYAAENSSFGPGISRELDVFRVNFSDPLGLQHIHTYPSNLLGYSLTWPPGQQPMIVDICVLPAMTNGVYMGAGEYAEHNWIAVLYTFTLNAQWFIEIFDTQADDPVGAWQYPIYATPYRMGHALAMDVDPANFEIYVLHDDQPLGSGTPRLTCLEYY